MEQLYYVRETLGVRLERVVTGSRVPVGSDHVGAVKILSMSIKGRLWT